MFKTSRGFTLIELMIVVTLISILSAIAIPSLLQAKMAGNETGAISSLKTIHTSQTTYKRTDWDSDGRFEYARHLPELFESSGQQVELITRKLARAYRFGFPVVANDPTQWQEDQGYVFSTNLYYEVGNGTHDFSTDQGTHFGAHAWPAGYNLTGRNTYAIGDSGVVWQREWEDLNPDDPSDGNPNYDGEQILQKPTMKAYGWISVD